MSAKRLKQAETTKKREVEDSENLRDKRPRIRIFPIWLRIIIVIILAIFALVGGLMIGYGIIGDGNPIDVLKVETWQHIIDIVIKE